MRGIGTQVHYIPVHQQPYYKERYGVLELPGASTYYSRCLSLPLWPEMDFKDVDFVIESLAEILGVTFESNTSFDAKAK
jgi:dTDP-4-amino-4,6-dideoxygalactose transaminase